MLGWQSLYGKDCIGDTNPYNKSYGDSKSYSENYKPYKRTDDKFWNQLIANDEVIKIIEYHL